MPSNTIIFFPYNFAITKWSSLCLNYVTLVFTLQRSTEIVELGLPVSAQVKIYYSGRKADRVKVSVALSNSFFFGGGGGGSRWAER